VRRRVFEGLPTYRPNIGPTFLYASLLEPINVPHLIPIEIMALFLPAKILIFLPLKIFGDLDGRGSNNDDTASVPNSFYEDMIKMSTKINMPFLLANFQ